MFSTDQKIEMLKKAGYVITTFSSGNQYVEHDDFLQTGSNAIEEAFDMAFPQFRDDSNK